MPVATNRTPVALGATVVRSDLAVAPGGVFSRLHRRERGLGDPGNVGQEDKVYAPWRKNMNTYVDVLDKSELTLQRRIEMANGNVKQFKCLGTPYRKVAVHALEIIAIVVAKLVFVDEMLNQDQSVQVHVKGPIPDLEASVWCRRSGSIGVAAFSWK